MTATAALPSGASAWFDRLPPAFRAFIAARGRVVARAAGTRLFARGDDADGLYAVLDGAIEIGAVGADGAATMLTVVQAGTWFGEIALVDGLARTHDAVALQASTLLHLPQAPLLAFLDRTPACWREIALLLAEKLRLSFAVVEDAALLPAPQRLAARLVMIAEGYGGASRGQSDVRLSQAQLAAMLTLSRQTVNRCLKTFVRRGLIASGQGHVEILDLAGLRRVCATG